MGAHCSYLDCLLLLCFLCIEPEWVEVVTEILLSLLSKPSHLLRTVVDGVFKMICPQMTPEALQLLLNVSPKFDLHHIEKQNKILLCKELLCTVFPDVSAYCGLIDVIFVSGMKNIVCFDPNTPMPIKQSILKSFQSSLVWTLVWWLVFFQPLFAFLNVLFSFDHCYIKCTI